ncbi:hypothetical protein C8F01DRAFT_1087987 [Mycena amicta]|nr:hypothetical protein C8F01DRAFT_1087987 [Mycena amicta]
MRTRAQSIARTQTRAPRSIEKESCTNADAEDYREGSCANAGAVERVVHRRGCRGPGKYTNTGAEEYREGRARTQVQKTIGKAHMQTQAQRSIGDSCMRKSLARTRVQRTIGGLVREYRRSGASSMRTTVQKNIGKGRARTQVQRTIGKAHTQTRAQRSIGDSCTITLGAEEYRYEGNGGAHQLEGVEEGVQTETVENELEKNVDGEMVEMTPWEAAVRGCDGTMRSVARGIQMDGVKHRCRVSSGLLVVPGFSCVVSRSSGVADIAIGDADLEEGIGSETVEHNRLGWRRVSGAKHNGSASGQADSYGDEYRRECEREGA